MSASRAASSAASSAASPGAAKPLWALRHPPVAMFAGAVGDLELPLLAPLGPLVDSLVPTLAPLAPRAVVSSPRLRCRELAQLLAAALDLPLLVEPRLRELEHGRWTGHSWDSIEANDHAAYRYWLAHWIESGPPGGGESARALTERVASAAADAPSHGLLVTHRGPLQALHHLAGLPWPEAAAVACPNAGEPGALWSVRADPPSFTITRGPA